MSIGGVLMTVLNTAISLLGFENFVLVCLFLILFLLAFFRRDLVEEILVVSGLIVLMIMGKIYGFDNMLQQVAGFYVAVTLFEYFEKLLKRFAKKSKKETYLNTLK